MEKKKCIKCNIEKELHEFYKHGKYIKSKCKKCIISKYDPESQKKKNKEYYQKNKNILIKKRNEQKKKQNRNNPVNSLFKESEYRSKKNGINHTINKKDIIIPEKCPIFGIILEYASINRHNSPSLDRLDSNKGYTKDNINVISYRANFIKGNATFEEFEAIYKWWKAELKKREDKLCPSTTSE